QIAADALAEAAGEGGAFVHGHLGDRDERHDVDGADARVRAAVRRHIDQLHALFDEPIRRLEHRLRLADEGDDGAIRVGARIDVQQRDAWYRGRSFRNGLVDLRPSTLGDVGNALDELHVRGCYREGN